MKDEAYPYNPFLAVSRVGGKWLWFAKDTDILWR